MFSALISGSSDPPSLNLQEINILLLIHQNMFYRVNFPENGHFYT